MQIQTGAQLFCHGVATACLASTMVFQVVAVAAEPASLPADKPFVHPGLLHTQDDLDLIRKKVAAGEEPWKSGFEKLKINWQSLADWKVRGPFELVVRDPQHSQHDSEMALDGNAAYQTH